MFKPSVKLSVDPKVIIVKAERALNKRELEKLGQYDVYVGWPASARSLPDEDGKTASIALYAKANNYGVYTSKKQRIPARPFMNYAMNDKKFVNEREVALRIAVGAVRMKKIQALDVLDILGQTAVKNVRTSIKSGPWKPNSPITLLAKIKKAKGKDNGLAPRPLIDTGQMIDRVTYVVKERKI